MIVSRHVRVLVGVVYALTATATLAAAKPPPAYDWEADPQPPPPVVEQQVAVEVVAVPIEQPQPPIEDPYYVDYVEPAPVEYVPDESIVVTATAMTAWLSQPSGLETAMRGGTVGFSWLQRDGEFPTGAEVTGIFLFGDRASSYDLSVRVIGSPKIGKRMFVPYAAIGIAVGASRVMDAHSVAMSKDPPMSSVSYGFAIGPSAAVGVHGFLGKKYYWRAGAGFVAAGIGAITADLGVGMVVD